MARRPSRPSSPRETNTPREVTVAVIRTGAWPADQSEASRFLEWEFTRWAWEARFPTWTAALRSLARTLAGLEHAGFIKRQRLPPPHPTGRLITLTDEGRRLLRVLTGEPIRESDDQVEG